jgi:hypothetical protein
MLVERIKALQGYGSQDLQEQIKPITQEIHRLYPECRLWYRQFSELWNAEISRGAPAPYVLALYVEPGKTRGLPLALKYHAYYIEEVYPDGSADIRKNALAPVMGRIPQTTEPPPDPLPPPSKTAWERLLDQDPED